MNLFIDANVLVAVLNREYPLFSDAARVLSLGQNSRFKLFTSPVCLAIAFYFSEKKSGSSLAKSKIALLVEHINIAPLNENAVNLVINNKSIYDFEDGLEYFAALGADCKVIVTEDKNDFYFSEIPVFNCKQLLENISEFKK